MRVAVSRVTSHMPVTVTPTARAGPDGARCGFRRSNPSSIAPFAPFWAGA